MSEVLLQVRRLAAAEVVTSRAARRAVLVAAFAVLTALSAYVAVWLPGTAVPITLQVMVVILAGALLGPGLGAASQVTYLVAGALGAPVFSGGAAGFGHLFGPTGGFLLAFPVGAAVAGALAPPPRSGVADGADGADGAGEAGAAPRRRGDLLRLGVALALGSVAILTGGAAQLAILTGDVESAIRLGVIPFLPGDAIKIAGALLVASRIRSRTLGLL